MQDQNAMSGIEIFKPEDPKAQGAQRVHEKTMLLIKVMFYNTEKATANFGPLSFRLFQPKKEKNFTIVLIILLIGKPGAQSWSVSCLFYYLNC
jgi:hypothetical protein